MKHGIILFLSIIFTAILMTISVFEVMNTNTERSLLDANISYSKDYYSSDMAAVKVLSGLIVGEDSSIVQKDITDEGEIISYKIQMNDEQSLDIKILNNDGIYTIEKWRVIKNT